MALSSPVAFLLAAAFLAPTPRPIDEEADPLSNVVTIGASVTAGYGNASELKTDEDAPLAVFLAAAAADENARFTGEGDRWFFSNAGKVGKRQVEDALAASPSLVVGVDYLFWHAFGNSNSSDPRREVGLEAGLAQLDRFGCPLVIGDLPDVSHALQGKGPFGGPLVTRDLFPTDEERARMNRRIREWAEKRGDVAIVPLAEMTANMVEGRPIAVQDLTWTAKELSDALQPDLLHPHVHGTIWVSLLVLDAATRLDGIDSKDFVWDHETIMERLTAATEASRAKRAERERKRRERRERRERAKKG
ncbi:MAG: SGNH/GDSL hydrolase family protein [Planctomycetota bacterium]